MEEVPKHRKRVQILGGHFVFGFSNLKKKNCFSWEKKNHWNQNRGKKQLTYGSADHVQGVLLLVFTTRQDRQWYLDFADEETETEGPGLPKSRTVNKLLSQDLSQFHPTSKSLFSLCFFFENKFWITQTMRVLLVKN